MPFIISVEAIRERSGDRWDRKRDDVWGYLGRKLNEYLSYQDIHQRLNETDVLVAMTTEDGVAAQAVGMKVLEDVLEFFLGAAERKDIRIRAVSRIDGPYSTSRSSPCHGPPKASTVAAAPGTGNGPRFHQRPRTGSAPSGWSSVRRWIEAYGQVETSSPQRAAPRSQAEASAFPSVSSRVSTAGVPASSNQSPAM